MFGLEAFQLLPQLRIVCIPADHGWGFQTLCFGKLRPQPSDRDACRTRPHQG